jgi:hypothetical protein
VASPPMRNSSTRAAFDAGGRGHRPLAPATAAVPWRVLGRLRGAKRAGRLRSMWRPVGDRLARLMTAFSRSDKTRFA